MYQSIFMPRTKKLIASALALAFATMLALCGCAAQGDADSTQSGAEATHAQQAPDAAASDNAQGAASDGAQDAVKVSVSVAMPEGADAASESCEVALPDQGTVYDALMATGWDVKAEDGDYGTYVTSINGVANGSEGEASGWVFTVNNEQVMEGCGTHTLNEGDTVEWSFYVG